MASTTIAFGVVLALLGAFGSLMSGAASVTALIPTMFGVPLIVLGLIARAESRRKHAMHAAAALALLGFAGALASVLRTPAAPPSAMASFSQWTMVVLTGVFIGLCVKSFIDARRARAA